MQRDICLVHDWLTGMRGGEKCLEPLCREFPHAPLLTLLHRRGSVSSAIERMNVRSSAIGRLPGAARYYRSLLPLMPAAMARLAVPPDCQLVLSFSHAVAKGVAVPSGVPHLCYCFTPMRYAWQLRDDYLPRRGAIGKSKRRAADAVLDRLRSWDRESAQKVTRFLAVSRTVAARIRQCYDRDSQVIYPPVDTEFYTPDDGPRDDYYLCVSALVPYKRLDLAVQACRRLGRRLVIVGSGPEARRLQKLAGSDQIKLVGWSSNEEIRRHLRRCRALLFPGREDFGIVPVEAQACGAPVIAFGAGGATESLLPADKRHTGTGVFFAEQTVDSLASAIEWHERHRNAVDPALARKQAEKFAAPRYLRQMLAAIDETLASVGEDHPAAAECKVGVWNLSRSPRHAFSQPALAENRFLTPSR